MVPIEESKAHNDDCSRNGGLEKGYQGQPKPTLSTHAHHHDALVGSQLGAFRMKDDMFVKAGRALRWALLWQYLPSCGYPDQACVQDQHLSLY